MKRVVEKPNAEEAPSNLSVIGCYVLDKQTCALLEKTPLSVMD